VGAFNVEESFVIETIIVNPGYNPMAQNLFERFSYDLGIAKIHGSFTFKIDIIGKIGMCFTPFHSTSINIIIVWLNLF